MMRETAFWDSSALVPLCVYQTATPAAMALRQKYDAVIWWLTPVEISGALARLVRMGQLAAGQLLKADKLATELALSWFVIQPLEAVRLHAMQLVRHHDLRAADALQLAAALEWCNRNPNGRAFIAADRRLREAAALQGFDVPAL